MNYDKRYIPRLATRRRDLSLIFDRPVLTFRIISMRTEKRRRGRHSGEPRKRVPRSAESVFSSENGEVIRK